MLHHRSGPSTDNSSCWWWQSISDHTAIMDRSQARRTGVLRDQGTVSQKYKCHANKKGNAFSIIHPLLVSSFCISIRMCILFRHLSKTRLCKLCEFLPDPWPDSSLFKTSFEIFSYSQNFYEISHQFQTSTGLLPLIKLVIIGWLLDRSNLPHPLSLLFVLWNLAAAAAPRHQTELHQIPPRPYARTCQIHDPNQPKQTSLDFQQRARCDPRRHAHMRTNQTPAKSSYYGWVKSGRDPTCWRENIKERCLVK